MILIGFLICLFFIGYFIMCKKNCNTPIPLDHATERFCILIPAREEANVIEDLLISIQNQTRKIPMQDVYVIVERDNDPSVAICKKYQVSVFVRKHLNLRRKGYALQECLEAIYPKNYDAYFIFDADNILDKDFIHNMVPIYRKGYDIGVGYRNIKNGKNVIASSAVLTFSIMNTLANEKKNRDTRNITISGTGFFIQGKWIQKWRGFPFHELTEDYELYLYSITQNMTSFYNKRSVFYDEQPNTFRQSFIQRRRWIRGYLDCRKKYVFKIWKSIHSKDVNWASKKIEILGLFPLILLLFIGISPTLYHLYGIFQHKISPCFLLIDLIFIYFILFFLTIYILIKEKSNLAIDSKIKWKVALYHPIFLISYVPCFFSVLLTKNIEWKKIEHTSTVQNR